MIHHRQAKTSKCLFRSINHPERKKTKFAHRANLGNHLLANFQILFGFLAQDTWKWISATRNNDTSSTSKTSKCLFRSINRPERKKNRSSPIERTSAIISLQILLAQDTWSTNLDTFGIKILRLSKLLGEARHTPKRKI